MRMKLLSDKWQNISITADKEKLEKKGVLKKKLKILEERISYRKTSQ